VLAHETRARLIRLTAVADELLASARSGYAGQPLQRELEFLIGEAAVLLREDPPLAREFEHIVAGAGRRERPVEVRAASLAGWLNGALVVDLAQQQPAALPAPAQTVGTPQRQPLGLKILSSLARQPEPGRGGIPVQ
jgi:hypothetical protein